MKIEEIRDRSKIRLFGEAILGLLAIVGYVKLGTDIYDQIYPKVPKIVFDVSNSVSLANLKGAGSDVKVSYKNAELSQDQVLTAYVVNVKNDSPKDLAKQDFDPRHSFGMTLEGGGVFVAAEITKGPNPYLAQDAALMIRTDDKNQLLFSPFVFNSNESFELKIFVLQHEYKELELAPVGLLTGIRKMDVTYSFRSQPKESFLSSAFRGPILIQLVRLFFYGIICFCLAISPIVLWYFLFYRLPKFYDRRKLKRLERVLTEEERSSPEFCALKVIVDKVRPFELDGHLPDENQNRSSYLFKDSLGGWGAMDEELRKAILLPGLGGQQKFTPKFLELSKRLKKI